MRAWNTDKFIYIGVLLAVFIYLVVFSSGFFNKILSSVVFTTLGKFSFSIYLWHMGVVMYLSKNYTGSYWFFVLTIALSVILGAVSFYVIENPLESARHKIMNYIFKENVVKINNSDRKSEI
jgi:peptidoglycan/LPS O-acetylase OafA/YrhL